MKPVTRREFLRSLWPSRLTRRLILGFAIGAFAVFLVFQVYSIVRSQGAASSTRILLVLAGVGLAVFALQRLVLSLQRGIANASEDFRTFVTRLMRALEAAVSMCLGAYLYHQWSSGIDIVPTLTVIALTYLSSLLHDGTKG